MSTGPLKSWTERLLEFALAMVAAAWLLTWAWTLLKPLVPVIIVAMGVMVVAGVVVRRFYGSW